MNKLASVKKYNTRQRNLILKLLLENKDRPLTAEEMWDFLKQKDTPVGKATLYRYLEVLVAKGEVYRFIDVERFSAFYQYIDENINLENCFHLKCFNCGKIIPVECNMIDKLNKHIFNRHAFNVDASKTIFYGECNNCQDLGRNK